MPVRTFGDYQQDWMIHTKGMMKHKLMLTQCTSLRYPISNTMVFVLVTLWTTLSKACKMSFPFTSHTLPNEIVPRYSGYRPQSGFFSGKVWFPKTIHKQAYIKPGLTILFNTFFFANLSTLYIVSFSVSDGMSALRDDVMAITVFHYIISFPVAVW